MIRWPVLLALVATSAAAFEPGRSIAVLPATGTVEVAFTPGGRADDLIIGAVARARRQVLVQAFSFTHRRIAEALIDAHRAGLDVQVIADAEQTARIATSVVPLLVAEGVPVLLDSRHDSAHNKIMVIDAGTPDAALVTGSYNFTHAAQFRNAENVLVLRGNPPLVDAYLRNWKRHHAHALPYRDRP